MAPTWIPKAVVVLAALPKNASGKVLKQQLKKMSCEHNIGVTADLP
ncbi:MAG TPA: hypothetical protein VE957_12350 [Terriglobales bacterium]|nr:hypothetical protein [Terriglobales bacterium]